MKIPFNASAFFLLSSMATARAHEEAGTVQRHYDHSNLRAQSNGGRAIQHRSSTIPSLDPISGAAGLTEAAISAGMALADVIESSDDCIITINLLTDQDLFLVGQVYELRNGGWEMNPMSLPVMIKGGGTLMFRSERNGNSGTYPDVKLRVKYKIDGTSQCLYFIVADGTSETHSRVRVELGIGGCCENCHGTTTGVMQSTKGITANGEYFDGYSKLHMGFLVNSAFYIDMHNTKPDTYALNVGVFDGSHYNDNDYKIA